MPLLWMRKDLVERGCWRREPPARSNPQATVQRLHASPQDEPQHSAVRAACGVSCGVFEPAERQPSYATSTWRRTRHSGAEHRVGFQGSLIPMQQDLTAAALAGGHAQTQRICRRQDLRALSSAVQVSLPTMPSTGDSPRCCWNAATATSVPTPKSLSTASMKP